MEKYYPGEPVNIHIQLLITIIQDNNRVITTKKVRGKLTLFCGNVGRLIPIYAEGLTVKRHNKKENKQENIPVPHALR